MKNKTDYLLKRLTKWEHQPPTGVWLNGGWRG
jgi:hypothetical protein